MRCRCNHSVSAIPLNLHVVNEVLKGICIPSCFRINSQFLYSTQIKIIADIEITCYNVYVDKFFVAYQLLPIMQRYPDDIDPGIILSK